MIASYEVLSGYLDPVIERRAAGADAGRSLIAFSPESAASSSVRAT